MTTLAKSMTLLIADMVGGLRESFVVRALREALLPEPRSGVFITSKAETQ